MKRLAFALAVACAAATAIAAPQDAAANSPAPAPAAPGAPRKAALTREQRKALAQRTMMMRTGGFIVRPGTQLGKVVYVNGQKRVPQEVIEKQTSLLSEILCVRIEMVPGDGKFSLGDVARRKKELGANAVIFFADDPSLEDTMLVAPETGWAVVNFAAIAKDGPDEEHLRKRAIRETWRSFAHLLGAADSNEPKCVLRPVSSPGDLDDLFAECFCPEPLDKISRHLRAIGVDPAERKTYKRACEEGWAPAPTNEFQKVIWEKVKADKERGPTNPITIQPPNQKK